MFDNLSKALEDCGLPGDPKQIVGRPFVFGDDLHVISGTVTSIHSSPGCLVLYVSSPRFGDQDIRSLVNVSGLWCIAPIIKEARVGSFRLL